MKIKEEINKQIFREYDLRGIYPIDIDSDTAYTIGVSFGSVIKKMGETKTIVGHDNRESGEELTKALIEGITSTGIDVYTLGLVTTPMYYWAKKDGSFKTGIMVTASHNPREYNGFKISFDEIGNAYGEKIQAFLKFTLARQFEKGTGNIIPYSIQNSYLDLIQNSIQLGKRKLKVVVDCGNGTGSVIVKEIFNLFDLEVEYLFCESDPTFPNHHPDPSVPKNMIALGKKVVELGYDLGIGIDGDADRVGIVDANGFLIPIDQVMLLIYQNLDKKLKNRKALFDVKCGKTLIDGLTDLNIEKVMYRTGASYTNMMVNTQNFDFGGEFSGHLFFNDKWPGFDDGIYAGLRIIEILSNTEGTIQSLLKGKNHYESTEEIKIEIADDKKFEVVEQVKQYAIEKNYNIITIDGVRVEWKDGWALVRASNTGPNITLRFEGKTKERLAEIQKEFTDLLMELV